MAKVYVNRDNNNGHRGHGGVAGAVAGNNTINTSNISNKKLNTPQYDNKPRSPSASTTTSHSFAPSISSKNTELSVASSATGISEAPLTPKPEQRKIGRWYIGETLGKGGYSWVKKGVDEKNGKFVALKFVDRKKSNGQFSTKRAEQMKTEITVMKNMKHPNIVRLFAYNMKAKYPERDDAAERDVMLLVLEYMSGGELFDILYYTNALPEVLARTYFHQLMAGVESLHNAGIVHRDLKPQNLLFDKRFTLKISDFGLSKIIKSDEDALMQTYKVGTRGYQAPEILLKKAYTGACDIFACGVILFLLLTGYPPFQQASVEDRWYGNIARGKLRKFWKQHRGCGLGPYAIDLVTKMLGFDPNARITLANIKKHPWYNQEIVDNSKELRRLVQLRHKQMEVKRANDPIKQQILVASEKFRALGSHDDEKTPTLVPPQLNEEDGIGIFDVFTTHSAKEVLTYIQNFSKAQFGFTPIIDMKSFTTVIQTAFQSDAIAADSTMCEALISVWYYKEYECNLVKFVKLSGDHTLWRRTYEQLMVWLRPVLDGVPKEIAEKEFAITSEDEALIAKYFDKSSNKTANKSASGAASLDADNAAAAAAAVSAVSIGSDADYDVDYS